MYILQKVRRDILPRVYKIIVHRLKIQPLHGITALAYFTMHYRGTPKHNNYKRHDKLGYSSICYIGSKIGWVPMKEVYKL